MLSKKPLHVGATALVLAALVACSADDDETKSSPEPVPVTTVEAGTTAVDEGGVDAEVSRSVLLARADEAPSLSTHLTVLDLATGAVQGELERDGELSVHASNGRAFLIDADRDRFVALDPAQPWQAAWTHEPSGEDAPTTNTIVAANDAAYVLRAESNEIEILSLVDGTHLGTIDLADFVDPLDADGFVDVSDGFFDATTGRVYVVLPRTRLYDSQRRCSGSKALLVGIDAATRALVDLNGDAAGAAIELAGQRPASSGIVLDGSGLVAYLAQGGCVDEGGALTGAGVERIDLASGTSSLVVSSDATVPPAKLLGIDERHAFVQFAAPTPLWRAWDPTTTSLGSFENGIPSLAAAAAGTRIVGLIERAIDDGTTLDVISFDPTARTQSFVAQDVLNGNGRTSASIVVMP